MLAQVRSCAIVGLEGALVEVEVDLANGLAGFTIVGLADTAIQEARERVRAAIKNSGATFPYKRITVNLAPADLRKEGPVYDLPIAIGILLASGQLVPAEPIADCLFLGELSLDGSVRHTNGILPMVALARERGLRAVFVPAVDAREAALVRDVPIYAVETLAQLMAHLSGEQRLAPFPPNSALLQEVSRHCPPHDLAAVRGQDHVKRALEVAVSGGHNLLMSGPPGTGKTLLARATPSIMPPLSIEEALDVTRIYSVGGLLPPEVPLIMERPFRAPHHTISHAGLVGGGRQPRPGEISLAHRGVLFLDELPEFNQYVLEALRQPLEDKVVTISRAQGSVTFPANFMLIAAMNPCPCGYLHDVARECTCSPAAVRRYQKRVSGPLLDRIDIQVEVPRVAYEKLAGAPAPERTERIRARVEAARERQRQRFARTRLTCNAEMGPAEVQAFCRVDEAGQRLLKAAVQQLALSARAFHRLLKLARTIADLEGAELIGSAHVAEAVQYRPRIAP
ncbi:Fis family transcriptional regulator [Thermogemmatispora aurantia]|jgi:magnesium chelatase family protein|uniref:Fis family transcriptional regulator n=1 Tax=Thermogemmatispora aurantia TaxID=2045279 RepID=A0A5J4K9W6_9CHLR|nr:YifB family Mg chelatase-like AAA ATPase [Thermogemmatispora aurantia]GER85368.1 Fis family transcriptional regulator [Thermogemmatispora aurantia]